MQHIQTRSARGTFKVLTSTRSAQAAMMTLRPGQSSSDEPENEHPRAEQWLFVVSGAGKEIVGRRRLKLREGSLLLIKKDEPHQITNSGKKPLITFNLY